MDRIQTERIAKDLSKKMVFLVGPRQVGKTWLARDVIGSRFSRTVYLNYDSSADREMIRKEAWRADTELLILDEVHKLPGWKNRLKGIWDTRSPGLRIMVTGSSRLDTFRKAGDALSGRYFAHRLMPLSLRELAGTPHAGQIDRLLERGGFPDPFLSEDPVDAKRWRMQYADGLIRQDILDFENVHDLRAMQLTLALLQERVGSPLSAASMARDIGISPATVIRYVQILEALYIVFRVTPFAHNIARSLLKEPKVYFFDVGMVKGDGPRLENLVALSLLKHVYGLVDYQGEEWALHYLRTKDGREADFCLARDQRIESVIEVKQADAAVSRGLAYFCDRYGLRGQQLVKELRTERTEGALEIRRASDALASLFL